ncbi:MAG TPA: hypothetical protein PLX46_02655 [Thiobacillaceae bacterium]|nr:hypothetical protein [Thiobacillaceae bacterium]
MKTLLLLLTTLISSTALALESPSDVTDSQVSFYQLGMETGCKDAGRRKGDAAEKVEAFCNCMMQALKDDLTFAEWQQAYFFSRNHQDHEEMQILGPHMRKVQRCRNNAL